MATLTIEIKDVSVSTLAAIAARAEDHQAGSLEDYVRLLIAQDTQAEAQTPVGETTASGRLRTLLNCIHRQAEDSGCTEADLDCLFEQARDAARQTQSEKQAAPALGENHPLAKVAGSMSGDTWREVVEEMRREREEEDARALEWEMTEATHVPS